MEKRILIFDDDEDILILCRYILEDMGWEVHTRTTCVGVEAVEQQCIVSALQEAVGTRRVGRAQHGRRGGLY